MNPTWIKALVLVCIFGAVVLAVEVLVRWFASSRTEGRAINLRLKMIGRGHSYGETLNLLRRSESSVSSPGCGSSFDSSAADARRYSASRAAASTRARWRTSSW